MGGTSIIMMNGSVQKGKKRREEEGFRRQTRGQTLDCVYPPRYRGIAREGKEGGG